MRIILVSLAFAFLLTPANAASTRLHGVRLSCSAARAIYILPRLPRYYAQADLRRRIIYLGAHELRGMTRAELTFVMAHECGHLIHGRRDSAADAYAAQRVLPSARLCRIIGRCRG
jgi:hypothetical protein